MAIVAISQLAFALFAIFAASMALRAADVFDYYPLLHGNNATQLVVRLTPVLLLLPLLTVLFAYTRLLGAASETVRAGVVVVAGALSILFCSGASVGCIYGVLEAARPAYYAPK